MQSQTTLKKKTTHDVLGQLVSRQVLDVLVRAVDDLGELFAVDLLLKHVHRDAILERGQPFGVHADDFGNGRAPSGMENRKTEKTVSGGISLDNLFFYTSFLLYR